MGFIFSKLLSLFVSKRKVRILILGFEAAGKASILYQMKIGKLIKTIPTIGFNVEQIDYKGLNITLLDICDHFRVKIFYQISDGIIFVVDSNDKEIFEIVRDILLESLNDERLKDAAFLIFANKQDLNGAISPIELTKILEIEKIKNRKWFVQGSSAVSGQGIKEGLDWLANTLLIDKKE